MTKWRLALALAAMTAACSPSGQPQSAAPADQPAPPAAAPSAAQPAAATPEAPATSASSPAAASAAAPAAPPAPASREITIPADTPLSVTLRTSLASNTSKVEDPVRGTLAKALVIDGTTVVPAGAEITGSVIEANQSGRVKGRASLAFRFDRITVRNESHRIQTARIARQAASTQGKDAKKIGIGAGVGAVIGGIAGGGKGAAIGAGVGGGAGTGAVLATRGKEVTLPAGTVVATRLDEPVRVIVPMER